MGVDDLYREYFKQTKMLRGDLYAINGIQPGQKQWQHPGWSQTVLVYVATFEYV